MVKSDHQWRQLRVRRRGIREIYEAFNLPQFGILSIQELTRYQIRLNDVLDLYPTGQKWHDIKTGERGIYVNVISLLRERNLNGKFQNFTL